MPSREMELVLRSGSAWRVTCSEAEGAKPKQLVLPWEGGSGVSGRCRLECVSRVRVYLLGLAAESLVASRLVRLSSVGPVFLSSRSACLPFRVACRSVLSISNPSIPSLSTPPSSPLPRVGSRQATDVAVVHQGRIIYLGYDFSEPVVPWVHALIASTMFNDYDFKGEVPTPRSRSSTAPMSTSVVS